MPFFRSLEVLLDRETLQLRRTLSFMRENDEDAQMSVKSFEHCIEQQWFAFTFRRTGAHPLERSCRFHRPAVGKSLWFSISSSPSVETCEGCSPWVGANPCSEGANDGPPKKSVNIRTQVIHRKLGHALCQGGSRPCRPLSSEAEF